MFSAFHINLAVAVWTGLATVACAYSQQWGWALANLCVALATATDAVKLYKRIR